MKIGDIVHVIGFTSPTSTGYIVDVTIGATGTTYYTVDFDDGEVTDFEADEIAPATPEQLAVWNRGHTA